MRIECDPGWEMSLRASESLSTLDAVDSTNTWALNNRVPEWGAVLTLNQQSGRGRWGRQWESRPHRDLALSVVVPMRGPSDPRGIEQDWIPLVAGACLSEALTRHGMSGHGVKWPNDLHVDGRKLAGILTEVDVRGLAIVGVGINVFSLEAQHKHKRAALEEFFSIGSETLDQLVGAFILKLRETAELPAPGIKTLVSNHLLTIGRKVSVHEFSGSEWIGTAVGIDDSGSLLVQAEDGRVLAQRASEIQHIVQ